MVFGIRWLSTELNDRWCCSEISVTHGKSFWKCWRISKSTSAFLGVFVFSGRFYVFLLNFLVQSLLMTTSRDPLWQIVLCLLDTHVWRCMFILREGYGEVYCTYFVEFVEVLWLAFSAKRLMYKMTCTQEFSVF